MTETAILKKLRIGISECLLGAAVRFDGGHKYDGFVVETLGQFFEFVPYCPEVAIGLGVPREPIRLVGDPKKPRVVGVRHPELDVTDALQAYSENLVPQLNDISGYILKRKSPSCGMERVKVYQQEGAPPYPNGVGIFARVLQQRCPLLPMEEEGRLNDPALRENFIERVFTFRRWQELLIQGLSAQALVKFHTIHKYTLMAHSTVAYQNLGKKIAQVGTQDLTVFANDYIVELMAALKQIATRKKHTNVLQHLLGYLKENLSATDKQEMLQLIKNYHQGFVPLIVPITLLNHHFLKFPQPYIAEQIYMHPYPGEMMLRNRV